MIAKKNLIAVAALLALAGAAQAQSVVKLYGSIDAGLSSIKTAGGSRATKVDSGNMMTSFIGFGGSEDLGGGMKAEFALEAFVGVDTGKVIPNNAGNFWGRASNVALSGGFGKVTLGQYDNPLFVSGLMYNPFGSSMTFSPTMRHLGYIGQTSGISNSGVGFDTGWVNSVTYESPNVQGFSFTGQSAFKEKAGATEKNSYAAAVSYNAGPLSAMLTYVKAGKSTSTTAYTADEKVVDFGASYNFGVAKGFVQYTDIKDDTNANKDKIYQLGVSIPVTDKIAVMASFGNLKDTTAAGVEKKDDILSLGYDLTVSKRTDIYGVVMNNRQTGLSSGVSYAVGIKHAF